MLVLSPSWRIYIDVQQYLDLFKFFCASATTKFLLVVIFVCFFGGMILPRVERDFRQ